MSRKTGTASHSFSLLRKECNHCFICWWYSETLGFEVVSLKMRLLSAQWLLHNIPFNFQNALTEASRGFWALPFDLHLSARPAGFQVPARCASWLAGSQLPGLGKPCGPIFCNRWGDRGCFYDWHTLCHASGHCVALPLQQPQGELLCPSFFFFFLAWSFFFSLLLVSRLSLLWNTLEFLSSGRHWGLIL